MNLIFTKKKHISHNSNINMEYNTGGRWTNSKIVIKYTSTNILWAMLLCKNIAQWGFYNKLNSILCDKQEIK